MVMKLRTIIKGGKVHEVGYRFFLSTKALELGCDKFYAKNQSEGGNQFVVAFFEGDELQLADFKMFAQSHRPEGSDVADIAFEDYSGPIMSKDAFLHFFTADRLNKGIPALLRIDRKQDRMLEKQDITIAKQEETRSDIVREIKTSREEVTAKLDDRLKRIESDIFQPKAKIGI
jgi:acylphosphatase